jgi:hypothetical protein
MAGQLRVLREIRWCQLDCELSPEITVRHCWPVLRRKERAIISVSPGGYMAIGSRRAELVAKRDAEQHDDGE